MTASGSHQSQHVCVWEFVVAEGSRNAFEDSYGPGGRWARLFSKGAGYLGTELLRDHTDPNRYLTIDRWRSERDYLAFRNRFKAEYEDLDRQCEAMTIRELKIGDFVEVGPDDTRS